MLAFFNKKMLNMQNRPFTYNGDHSFLMLNYWISKIHNSINTCPIMFKFVWHMAKINPYRLTKNRPDPSSGSWGKKSRKSPKSLSLIMGRFSKIHNLFNSCPIMLKIESHIAGINPYIRKKNCVHPSLPAVLPPVIVYNGNPI